MFVLVSLYFFSHTLTSQLQGGEGLSWLASLSFSWGWKQEWPVGQPSSCLLWKPQPTSTEEVSSDTPEWRHGVESCSGILPRLRKGQKSQILPWQRTVLNCRAHLWMTGLYGGGATGAHVGRPHPRPWESSLEKGLYPQRAAWKCISQGSLRAADPVRHTYMWIYQREFSLSTHGSSLSSLCKAVSTSNAGVQSSRAVVRKEGHEQAGTPWDLADPRGFLLPLTLSTGISCRGQGPSSRT